MISASEFYNAWTAICHSREAEILANWESCSNYTAVIFGGTCRSVLADVAQELGLESYCGYYALDAIFFEAKDRVPNAPFRETWVQNIRIAFEHENNFRGGLYQETSHLLITRAELRVLVTYPELHEVEEELHRLFEIISNSGLVDPAFLLITGKRNRGDHTAWKDVAWEGRTYSSTGWKSCAKAPTN